MKIKKFILGITCALLVIGGTLISNYIGFITPIRVYADSYRTVIVEPTDFLDYFQRNGSAANFEYDLATYTQTLTPNLDFQAGNVTAKTKIDMSQNFTFTGQINLGDKAQTSGGGGDGILFGFHPNDTDIT